MLALGIASAETPPRRKLGDGEAWRHPTIEQMPADGGLTANAFVHVAPQADVTLSYAGKPQDVYYMVQLDDARPNARRRIPGL